ncbi:unnamed protein product, partial [Bubo scandiacus]
MEPAVLAKGTEPTEKRIFPKYFMIPCKKIVTTQGSILSCPSETSEQVESRRSAMPLGERGAILTYKYTRRSEDLKLTAYGKLISGPDSE